MRAQRKATTPEGVPLCQQFVGALMRGNFRQCRRPATAEDPARCRQHLAALKASVTRKQRQEQAGQAQRQEAHEYQQPAREILALIERLLLRELGSETVQVRKWLATRQAVHVRLLDSALLKIMVERVPETRESGHAGLAQ